jgi:hypothetical protein
LIPHYPIKSHGLPVADTFYSFQSRIFNPREFLRSTQNVLDFLRGATENNQIPKTKFQCKGNVQTDKKTRYLEFEALFIGICL